MRVALGPRSPPCAPEAGLAPSRPHLLRHALHLACSPAIFARRGAPGSRRASITTAAAAPDTAADRPLWEQSTSEPLGPAAAATLKVLEWERLCRHVAGFAQTTLGQRAAATMVPASTPAASEALIAETRALQALETEFAGDIDFGGVQTAQASEASLRAARGGILSGAGLLAVASVLKGAAKLQKSIRNAAKEASATGLGDTAVLQPVLHVFSADLDTLPQLVSDIGFAVREDGGVRESASDEVKKAAARVRTVEGRLRGILKGGVGEVAEHAGRMCLAVQPSPDGPPRGILLGSGPGGSVWYVEPPAAVPLNNELAGAKGELAAAEEAVLWRLTGKVGDAAHAVERALHAVVWLDAVAARARYGKWIGGTLPRLVPFPKTGKARGGAARRQRAAAAAGDAPAEGTEEDVAEVRKHLVYLKKLRHPLLLGDYLLAATNAARSGDAHAGSGDGAGQTAVRREQRLPGWRPPSSKSEATQSMSLSSSESDEEGSSDDGSSPPGPRPPVPIDLAVAAATRAVVITGPNTGGKTAAMKALGLAALAARAGLPLPAADPALVPCFDSVLADIGDEQSLSASLSTFSGHLARISALRAESSGKSLVLLDELGTGTDPGEGAALGIAILRALARGGPGGAALAVATTHHSALTALKYDTEERKEERKGAMAGVEKEKPARNGASAALAGPLFENASVEFDEAALAPTYRLLWGVPGRSNALNIAARLGLDSEVVEAARERLGVAAAAVNDSIAVLEEARKAADRDEAAAAAAAVEAAEARAKTIALR